MAWFRCLGNGGSSPQLATVILSDAQISTTENSGTYIYPSYDDISNFDTISVKIYATINNVLYENYVSVDCGRLPCALTGIILYDENGNTWSQSLAITFTRNAVGYISYTGSWENLYINMIGLKEEISGPANYATGSFITGSSTFAKVEVNCGFQPDIVIVDMDFGNNTHTCATYFKTSNNFESSFWDLRPMEGVRYEITLDRTEGETGISDITSTGFKYRCNASNTQNKACTYIAIKF